MKLEFIPLYEVFEKYKGGCPICKIIKDEEKAYCEHLFEDEVLKDPEMYVKIRETNFCHYHLELLNNSYDKLGLAIALKENVTYKLQQITEKGKSLKKKRLGFLLKLLIVKSGSNVFKSRFEFSQKEKVERLVEQINKIARYYNINKFQKCQPYYKRLTFYQKIYVKRLTYKN